MDISALVILDYQYRHSILPSLFQGGGALRHVSEEKKAKPVAADSRGELLDQIRLGVTLKKVDPELLSRDDDVTSSAGIAGMLQKALRKHNFHSFKF